MTYRQDIDQLRALAVISVFFYHINRDLFVNGFLGVDLFFVISGYLISKIIFYEIKQGKFNIVNFYSRRIRRLLPLLLFVILIVLGASSFLLFPNEILSLTRSSLFGIFFTSNFFFWREINYFDSVALEKPLLHLWSLSIEEQFYIFFPILLIFLRKIIIKFLDLIIITLLIISLFIYINFYNTYPEEVFYFPFSRIWEILIGFLAFRFEQQKKIKFQSEIVFIIIIVILFFPMEVIDPFFSRMIICALALSFLCFKSDENIIGINILNYIGKISYGFYLWHFPIISILYIHNLKINLFSSIIIFCFTFLFSSITYFLIEKPFRDTKKIGSKIFSTSIIIFMTIIFIISFVIISKNGFIRDYDEENINLINLDKKLSSQYVIKNFNKFKDKPFLKNRKKNILIIGDSFAQDFTNIFLELNDINQINLSTKYISVECLNLYIPKDKNFEKLKPKYCKPKNQYYNKNLIKLIKMSDVIYLSSYWKNMHKPYIFNSLKNLNNITGAEIYVVGPKKFLEVNKRDLLKKKRENFEISYNIPNEIRELNNFYLDKIEHNYINLIELYCPKYSKCPVFIDNQLISHDGGHLTKEGVTLFVNKLKIDKRISHID